MIEKQFAELLEQVRAQFPEWQVYMSIMTHRYQSPGDAPTCNITLARRADPCECCHKEADPLEINAYMPTFAEALAVVAEKVGKLDKEEK